MKKKGKVQVVYDNNTIKNGVVPNLVLRLK